MASSTNNDASASVQRQTPSLFQWIPLAVLRACLSPCLSDSAAVALACSCRDGLAAVRVYPIKARLRLDSVFVQRCVERAPPPMIESGRFDARIGVPTSVHMQLASMDGGAFLQQYSRLPSSVHRLMVDADASFTVTPELRRAFWETLQIPAHVTSLDWMPMSRSLNNVLPPQLHDGIHHLSFGPDFSRPFIEAGHQLPARLEVLRCGGAATCHPLEECADSGWPDRLHTITFGRDFNQPIIRAAQWLLPMSLTELTFGTAFDQPLHSDVEGREVAWPPGLASLRLGSDFKQPLDRWSPPDSLTDFTLAECLHWPHTLAELKLPPNLRAVTLPRGSVIGCQSPPANFRWPCMLTRMDLSYMLWSPDRRLEWLCPLPCGLQELHLPVASIPVAGIREWPTSLTKLSLGMKFDHSLAGWTPPPGLTELHLGDEWAQDWSTLALPSGLKSLTCSPRGSLQGARWPASLTSLTFGLSAEVFDRTMADLPTTLTYFTTNADCAISNTFFVRAPDLRVLRLGGRFDRAVSQLILPPKLEELWFASPVTTLDARRHYAATRFNYPLHTLSFPPSFIVLGLPGEQFDRPKQQWCILPKSLRQLHLHSHKQYVRMGWDWIRLPPDCALHFVL